MPQSLRQRLDPCVWSSMAFTCAARCCAPASRQLRHRGPQTEQRSPAPASADSPWFPSHLAVFSCVAAMSSSKWVLRLSAPQPPLPVARMICCDNWFHGAICAHEMRFFISSLYPITNEFSPIAITDFHSYRFHTRPESDRQCRNKKRPAVPRIFFSRWGPGVSPIRGCGLLRCLQRACLRVRFPASTDSPQVAGSWLSDH